MSAEDQTGGDGKRNVLEIPDPHGVRKLEDETSDEYSLRLNRTITGITASIEELAPRLAKAETNWIALQKGTKIIRAKLAEEVPDLEAQRHLPVSERLEADAKNDFEVLDARMKDLRAKLNLFTDAFDALPE